MMGRVDSGGVGGVGRWARGLGLAVIVLVSLCGDVAMAADPAAHLTVVPSSVVELVGVDLEAGQEAQARVARRFLARDVHFATLEEWLARARLGKGLRDVLMMADGIGQSAFVVSLEGMNDLQRQTFEALFRASGLVERPPARGVKASGRVWFPAGDRAEAEAESISRPAGFSVLELSPSTFVFGSRSLIEQILTAATRRGGKVPAPAAVVALGSPPVGASAWFVSLAPGAEVPDPIVTSGTVTIDDGLLLELRFTCRTAEDAESYRDRARTWLNPGGEGHELDWLRLEPRTRSRVVVTRVEDRVHVVLTLTGEETSTLWTAALDNLAP